GSWASSSTRRLNWSQLSSRFKYRAGSSRLDTGAGVVACIVRLLRRESHRGSPASIPGCATKRTGQPSGVRHGGVLTGPRGPRGPHTPCGPLAPTVLATSLAVG